MAKTEAEPRQRIVLIRTRHPDEVEGCKQELLEGFTQRLQEYDLQLGADVMLHMSTIPPSGGGEEGPTLLAKFTFTAPVVADKVTFMGLYDFLDDLDEGQQRRICR